MPFDGLEILPRFVYGSIYEEMVRQGVDEAMEAALNLTATSMFESGYYSKIRDQQRATLRRRGVSEADLPPRYWVLYEHATYTNERDGSVDRGILMFNSVHQPGVTDAEAFNFQEACREGVNLYKHAGLAPWYGWKDIMSPFAIQQMRTNSEYPYRAHLEGALMRWRRTFLASTNYHLMQQGNTLIPATFF